MSTQRAVELYSIERSPLRRRGRQKDLALLLEIELKRLKRLVRDRQDFYWSKEEVINGKHRRIACPVGPMRNLHERLKLLLNRVEQPHYLYSPRRGRSAVMNAVLHMNAKVVVNLDIRQFYPSTTDEHVFRFFYYVMGMKHDVAGLLTKLCTLEGRLPFGSPLSPVLCSLVHRDLFDSIGAECMDHDLKLSVWVDDVTLSGNQITDRVIFEIKRRIARKGLRYHKVRRKRGADGIVITGAYVSSGGVAPANKTHVKMRDKLQALDASNDSEERLTIIRSLIGLNNHMGTVYEATDRRRERLRRQLAWLHNERRNLERRIDASAAERQCSLPHLFRSACEASSVPWE